MKKFAYKAVSLERLDIFKRLDNKIIQGKGVEEVIEIALNTEGNNGWELVSVVYDSKKKGLFPALAFLKKELI